MTKNVFAIISGPKQDVFIFVNPKVHSLPKTRR
jgi:hypothetical protein